MFTAHSKELVYGMRHGKTALDESGRSDNWVDIPLSDEGRQNVVTALDSLKNIPITCIYAPDFLRTKETAHIVKSGMPSDPDIEDAPDSKTWNLGSLSGSLKKPNKATVGALLNNPSKEAPNGESYNQFTARFDPWFQKQLDDSKEEGPFLLILSGSNCRRISELIFHDRDILDVDESGLFMLYPAGDGSWSAVMIDGQRDDHPEDS